MPIYQFECQDESCKHLTEELLEISKRNDPIPCEACHGVTARIPVPRSIGVWWKLATTDGKPIYSTMGPTNVIYPSIPEQKRKAATRNIPMYTRGQPGLDTNKEPGARGLTGKNVSLPPPGVSRTKKA